MVNVFTAYHLINESVQQVADCINKITPTPDVRVEEEYQRIPEVDILITERTKRLASKLTAAYNISEYRRQFYMSGSFMDEQCAFDILLKPIDDYDLTGFNMEEVNEVSRNSF